MSRIEVEEKIKLIIQDSLGVKLEDIKGESSIALDLGADGLDMVELIMYVEEEFGIDINDELAEDIGTVSSLVDLVCKKIAVN